ncbi:MAG: helix-turn-helix transcriptional regulator [Alphaproteobacteria bacterium]|nr:helix-turn-helix transcriptional regulator [Alphaproteobacteria bacterium]
MFIRTPADLGAAIRDRRKSLGQTQGDLAKRAGVGRQWLVAVEHGKPGAELAMVLRVLDALNMPLMTGAPPPVSASAAVRLDDIIASARGDES